MCGAARRMDDIVRFTAKGIKRSGDSKPFTQRIPPADNSRGNSKDTI